MSKLSRKIAILVLLAIINQSLIYAQSQKDAIEKVKSSMESVDLLFKSGSELSGAQISSELYDVSEDIADIEDWNQASKDANSADYGVSLSGGYDRKFGSGSDDPFDDYYSYGHRFYLMLAWDILSCGFIDKAVYNEKVDLQSQWKVLEENNYRDIAMINEASKQQTAIIYAHYNKLYESKVEVYKDLIEFQDFLLQKGGSTIYDKAELELQLAISQAAIRSSDVEVNHFISASNYISSQVEFTPEVIDSLLVYNHIINEAMIEGELINNEAASISYWDNAKVTPYVKVQHYSASTLGSDIRTVGQLGLSFSLPILSGTKQKQKEVEARSTLHANSRERITTSIRSEIELLAQEINNNLQLLDISAKVVDIHRQKIEVAKQMYESQQLPIQKLLMQYVTLLDSQIAVLDLIAFRESLKTRLLLLNNRN